MTTANSLTIWQRVLRAGGWTIAGYALSQTIRLGSNLIMTRLLVPEMFGVMAIATMVMVGLAMFSDVGLRQSVVQNMIGNEASFLNTVWAIQILRGMAIWLVAIGVGVLCASANRIGMVPAQSVYADPSLPFVIAVLPVTAVISGFGSTKLLEASRNLQLDRVTRIEVIAQLSGLLCMLVWVVNDRSIWPLVLGAIAASLTRMILSHIWLPGVRNRLQWNAAAHREIVGFGKWIFASSLLGFLVNNGDRLLLGGYVSANVLGIYVIAFLIYSAIEQAMSKVIGDVTFPAFSEVARERPHNLKQDYYRFHGVIASLAYFCAGLLMMGGAPLIRLLFDPRYAEAGWMLEILAVTLLVVPLHLATQCFLALGISRLLAKIIVVRLIALIVLAPVGFELFGLTGGLCGIALSQFSWMPMTLVYLVKLKICDVRMELRPLPMIAVGMGVAVLLVRTTGI